MWGAAVTPQVPFAFGIGHVRAMATVKGTRMEAFMAVFRDWDFNCKLCATNADMFQAIGAIFASMLLVAAELDEFWN